MNNSPCVIHELEWQIDSENYIESWQCKNCPYFESHFIECL